MESCENPQPPLLSRVLVLSDDQQTISRLKTLLEPHGSALHAVTSTSEALHLLPDGKFDLLVLDHDLASLESGERLSALHEHVRDVPWIVLTAQTALHLKLRSFDLGAWDHVIKPCDPAELAARIRAALHRKRLLDELGRTNNELKTARLAAEENARSKADFLANMSHEIRTPMNGVIAMTGLLLQTELHHDQRDFVETIRTSGEALLTIINDILNFSKIESGKLELEHRPLDLRACVEESLDLLGARAAEKGLNLLYEFDSNTPETVVGDVTRLRQILVNLVANAIKFTQHGEVEIRVQAQRLPARPISSPAAAEVSGEWAELQFSVRDTGIGIRPEKLHRLFQSFTQADSSTTREYGGTGLGLAISKGLVQLMGGEMWVESIPGQGSTFRFAVPLLAIPTGEAGPVAGDAPLNSLRILIVERNGSVRSLLGRYCTGWGMQATEVPDLRVGLELIRGGNQFDVVAAEAGVQPSDEPPALAAELRKAAGNSSLPLIFFTPLSSRPDRSSNTQFVPKPIKPLLLRNAILQALGTGRLEVRRETRVSKLDRAMAARMPLRVLLADDNTINQKVASRLLQQMGYQADIAGNGLEVLQALERKPYDVILMDVQMPGMDGLEATRQIRLRQKETPVRPHFDQPLAIIAMTANAMHGDREKCIAAGMNSYVSKPMRPESLQAALEQLHLLTPRAEGAPTPDCGGKAAEGSPGAEIIPAPTPAAPLVDVERLLDFAGGSVENFTELVELYLKQTTDQLRQIRLAMKEGVLSSVASISHSAAGASATCGMMSLVPLLRQLEHTALQGDATGSNPLMERIDEEFIRIKRFLAEHPKLLSAA